MAEALKTFREGEDILASETNENNQFLLSKLSDNAAQVQSYVEGEVATIKSNVSSVQATLQNNIDQLSNTVNTFIENIYTNIAPNYSAGVVRQRKTLYTASTAGWVYAFCLNNLSESFLKVNGVSLSVSKSTHSNTSCGAGTMVFVAKGDTYILEGGLESQTQYHTLIFYPCRGVEV